MSDTGQIRDDKLDAEAEARRQVALAQIRQYPDPALRMRANEIEEFDSGLAQLVERMKHLLHDANGLGLAATQIGVLQRVFIFQPNPEEKPVALVNPVFTKTSDERASDDEGCLSLQGVVIPVERHERVTVEAKGPTGEDVRLELEGLPRAGHPARGRPPRRDPDPRPDYSGSPARGAREPAAAAGSH